MSDGPPLPSPFSEATNPEVKRQLAEEEGELWQHFSTMALVGLSSSHGEDRIRDGAAAEMQRRLMEAEEESADASSKHSARLEELAAASGTQAEEVIRLTQRLKGLTVVIAWLAGVTLFVTAMQSVPLIIDFVKWLTRRG